LAHRQQTNRKEHIVRLLLSVIGACAVGAAFLAAAGQADRPAAQALNPPPPPWQTCKAVGSGTICEGTNIESVGPYDTGFVCGSGAAAFDIYDTSTDDYFVRKFFNENGNLVTRYFHDHYTFGENSNPLTGATVPYTQTDTRTDVLAVPGDLSSATETTTWEIEVHSSGGGAPLFRNTGRTIQAPDGTTEFRAGPLGFWDFFNGDTSVLGPLCAALGG
jgi:hypothetical protein